MLHYPAPVGEERDTPGDSSALPVSDRNPYSPSFLYGSGYCGGSAIRR